MKKKKSCQMEIKSHPTEIPEYVLSLRMVELFRPYTKSKITHQQSVARMQQFAVSGFDFHQQLIECFLFEIRESIDPSFSEGFLIESNVKPKYFHEKNIIF